LKEKIQGKNAFQMAPILAQFKDTEKLLPEMQPIWQDAVNRKFDDFLKSSVAAPPYSPNIIDIHDRMKTSGDHIVSLEVTPLTKNRNGRWAIHIQLVTVRPNSETETVGLWDIEDRNNEGHAVGKPLPMQELRVTVQTGI
jgi:transposase